MNAKHQFKYTYTDTELEEISPVDITFDMPGGVTITQMLYNFECYLKACGFVFDGRLEMVEDGYENHLDELDEEPQGGCMADFDKDEEESSCCNEGCGCLGDSISSEEYQKQRLKEWNEGLKNLEKLMQQKKRERENN